jgi:hypothetical protein
MVKLTRVRQRDGGKEGKSLNFWNMRNRMTGDKDSRMRYKKLWKKRWEKI